MHRNLNVVPYTKCTFFTIYCVNEIVNCLFRYAIMFPLFAPVDAISKDDKCYSLIRSAFVRILYV